MKVVRKKEYYTTKEVAEILNKSIDTIRLWMFNENSTFKRNVEFNKPEGVWLFSVEDVDNYANNRIKSKSKKGE